MTQIVDTGPKTFRNGATAIARYLRVRLSSGKLALAAAADADWLGVTSRRVAADDNGSILLRTKGGTMPMVAAGAIAAGAEVFAAADGKIAGTGTVSLGHILHAATADGDIVEVLTNT